VEEQLVDLRFERRRLPGQRVDQRSAFALGEGAVVDELPGRTADDRERCLELVLRAGDGDRVDPTLRIACRTSNPSR
jgi:hypothetical protein